MKKVAYIAPEIPSLSGTFVYNEIIALEDRGFSVTPISVHFPDNVVGFLEREDFLRLKEIFDSTYFLYQQSILAFLMSNLRVGLRRPGAYLRTLATALWDVFRVGLFSYDSLRIAYHFLCSSKVVEIIHQNGCEHLHIHFAHFPTQIGMYASSISGVPFSFTAHANDLFENNLLLKEKVDRAQSMITISDYNKGFLVSRGADKRKIHIVRCGVDLQNYSFRAWGGDSEPAVIGTLARLVEKKGVDVLLKAAKILKDKKVNFRLEVCGDGPLRADLTALANELDLGKFVSFKGVIPNDEVAQWLSSLDVFVLACQQDKKGDQDGIPVALMEAMARGVPVISTEISGIPELISDGKSGYLAKPGDPETLARAIQKYLSDPDKAGKVNMARQRIEQEFCQSINVDRLTKVFALEAD